MKYLFCSTILGAALLGGAAAAQQPADSAPWEEITARTAQQAAAIDKIVETVQQHIDIAAGMALEAEQRRQQAEAEVERLRAANAELQRRLDGQRAEIVEATDASRRLQTEIDKSLKRMSDSLMAPPAKSQPVQ